MDEEIEGGLAAVEPEAEDEGGDMSVYNAGSVRAAMAKRDKLNNEYKKYYDDLTAKLMAQRAGPSFSERMYQLSSAFFAPTSTRGFSGVMGNVMPVLQAQQQAQRQGEVSRQEALDKLRAAQLGQRATLANQDVSTALAMEKLNAAANKPVDPFKGAVYDPNTMRWVPRPGTAGGPPVLTPEQVAQLSRDPKNRGMKFYTTDGRPMEIK
jgi:hypothetical protein